MGQPRTFNANSNPKNGEFMSSVIRKFGTVTFENGKAGFTRLGWLTYKKWWSRL
jgi:hypothetical protein